jgi:general L-amino acid transport system ATP-binding protein
MRGAVAMTGATGPSQSAPAEPIIRMEDVHKWFGDFHVLRDINLAVGKGERIVVCARSTSAVGSW